MPSSRWQPLKRPSVGGQPLPLAPQDRPGPACGTEDGAGDTRHGSGRARRYQSQPLSPSAADTALSLSLSVSQLVSFTAGRAEPLCRAAGDIPRRHRLDAGSPTLMGRCRHPGPRDTAVTRRALPRYRGGTAAEGGLRRGAYSKG